MNDYSGLKSIAESRTRENEDRLADLIYDGEQQRDKYGLNSLHNNDELETYYDPDDDI